MAEVTRRVLEMDLSESHSTFLSLSFFIWNIGRNIHDIQNCKNSMR